MNSQKRVAAIHDISCFGRCSLTVALPIISAAGIETSVIPTAVLSTHTGGFEGYTYRDLSDDIMPIVRHWETLGLSFDAIYSGFLGSEEQIDMVREVFSMLKGPNTLIAVDPVMADNGSLYSIFPESFPAGMKRLCREADLVMPNLTEAALLLDRPYHDLPHTEKEIRETLEGLIGLGPRMAVLTGVSLDGSRLGAASLDSSEGVVRYSFEERIPVMYHGTGDVFGSALVSALTCGLDLAGACSVAVSFTVESLKRTRDAATDLRFGVNFEAGLAGLTGLIESRKG